ncbi:hypothetical protein DID88_001545 [Monilinia fructigena]|uniref:Uncharacterized protein n=1 Tax=Monilinia fructigena TaxID=38457 RepID=A0A395IYL3_9HELO|nr:hypothetical protein DID88_001545 [Monilinia fructigena]
MAPKTTPSINAGERESCKLRVDRAVACFAWVSNIDVISIATAIESKKSPPTATRTSMLIYADPRPPTSTPIRNSRRTRPKH